MPFCRGTTRTVTSKVVLKPPRILIQPPHKIAIKRTPPGTCQEGSRTRLLLRILPLNTLLAFTFLLLFFPRDSVKLNGIFSTLFLCDESTPTSITTSPSHISARTDFRGRPPPTLISLHRCAWVPGPPPESPRHVTPRLLPPHSIVDGFARHFAPHSLGYEHSAPSANEDHRIPRAECAPVAPRFSTRAHGGRWVKRPVSAAAVEYRLWIHRRRSRPACDVLSRISLRGRCREWSRRLLSGWWIVYNRRLHRMCRWQQPSAK